MHLPSPSSKLFSCHKVKAGGQGIRPEHALAGGERRACLLPARCPLGPGAHMCECFSICGSTITSGLNAAHVPHGQGDSSGSSRHSWDARQLSERQVHCPDGPPWQGEPGDRAGSFLMQDPRGKACGRSQCVGTKTLLQAPVSL